MIVVLVVYVLGCAVFAPLFWRVLMRDAHSLADDMAGGQMVAAAVLFWPIALVAVLLDRRSRRDDA